MKYLSRVLGVGLGFVLLCTPLSASAQDSLTPDLTVPALFIREVKITGEEFVVLQATVPIADLSEYWLGYVSSELVNPGAVVPTQQMPARALAAGQAVLLTSDGGNTCDAVFTTKLSYSLADTKGTLVVRRLESAGLTSTFTTVDSVQWVKPGVTGTTTVALDLRKEVSSLSYAVWYHDSTFTKPWRVGNLLGCNLTLQPMTAGTTSEPELVVWQQASLEPPAIIESVNEQELTPEKSNQPSENAGLAPPLITELVANPQGTGTDAVDEFIELYNSNDTTFSLAGFTLQTGLTTKHSYVFPNGTSIAPKSFITFYSRETGLSMSNTGGQASLLDRAQGVVAQSDPYDSAPDGQAWALANGTWYWTTKLTPSSTNIIAQPIAQPATAAKKLTVKTAIPKTTQVKSVSTKTKTTTPKKVTQPKKATPTQKPVAMTGPLPIHPGVLALVAASAVGYGAYVYRKDLANTLYKLRRH